MTTALPVPAAAGAAASADATLLERLRAGEERAYEDLVRAHGGRMLAVARRILRNDEEARDAVQEAMISAFKALPRFEGGCLLSTWLHRITVNAALMLLRSRKRSKEEPIEPLLPQFLEDGHHAADVRPWTGDGHDAFEAAERRAIVRSCIERLPETHRTVLMLRDIEELETKEIAELLGITENAVKMRVDRARRAARGLLAPHFSRDDAS